MDEEERNRVRLDKPYDTRAGFAKQANTSEDSSVESNLIYHLRQKREYYIRMLMDIQKAIDAVNNVR